MRKRITGGVIFILFLSAVSFFAYRYFYGRKVESLESIIPQNVLYYVYSNNPAAKIADFQATPLYKRISELSVYREYIKPQCDRLTERFPYWADFFRNDTGLAIFSPVDNNSSAIIDKIGAITFNDFLLLIRIKPAKKRLFNDSLVNLYFSLSSSGIKKQYYRGITINSYKFADNIMPFSFAMVSDIVLVSNNADVIRQSIDLYRSAGQISLAESSSFRKLLPKIERDALFWIYDDNKQYYKELLRSYSYDVLKSGGMKSADAIVSLLRIKPFMNIMNVLDGCVSVVDYDQSRTGLKIRSYHNFDSNKDEENLLSIFSQNKPLDDEILNLVGADIIGYLEGNQDFSIHWKFFKKFALAMDEVMKAQIMAEPRYEKYKEHIGMMGFGSIIATLESFLGIDIEKDILSPLGNKIGMVFAGFADKKMELPSADGKDDSYKAKEFLLVFPEIYCFVELKDKTKMKEVMQNVAVRMVNSVNQLIKIQDSKSGPGTDVELPASEKQLLKNKTEQYRGIELNMIELSGTPVDFMDPAHCILDKYIVFSSSADLIRKVIDIYKDRKDLFSLRPDFNRIKKTALEGCTNMLFLDVEKMVDNINSLESYKRFRAGLGENKNSFFPGADLDSVMEALKSITKITFSVKPVISGTLESACYIQITGL